MKTLECTSPLTAVEFDAHADSSRVGAVRYDADSSRDNRRTDLTHLADVRVTVTVKNLQITHVTVTILYDTVRNI